MTKRYGRNQRRKHRQEIEALTRNLERAEAARQRAASELRYAKDRAFQEYAANHDLLKTTSKALGDRIAMLLAPELERHASELMQQAAVHRPLLSLDSPNHGPSAEQKVQYIRGRIEPIEYTYAVLMED